MNEKLQGAIEVLIEKLREQEQDIIATKKMINSLRYMIGEAPLFQDNELQESQGIPRADLYYGKPLATAAREYLEFRNRACTLEEILNGLIQGGFDFQSLGWKHDRIRNNLAISLAKNTNVFHRLPNESIGLLTWYPEVIKRKSEREKTQEINGEKEKEGDEIEDEKHKNKAPTRDGE